MKKFKNKQLKGKAVDEANHSCGRCKPATVEMWRRGKVPSAIFNY